MKNKFTLLTCAFISTLLFGCGGSDSPFTEGGGSGSSGNIDLDKFTLSTEDLSPATVTVSYGDGTVTPLEEIQSINSISNGEVLNFSILASDRFRRLVSGATINFKTNYGSIDPTCTLNATGYCSVELLTLGSLPLVSNFLYNGYVDFDATKKQTIYINIIAYATGEESFIDLNGNGYFDDADIFLYDTDEPYIDRNNNGVYDANTDTLIIDTDKNGAYTPADGKYSGANCQHSTLCSTSSSTIIWARMYLDLVSS